MEREEWTLLSSIKTGLWRTGPELFGQMRQKSIGFDPLEGCMCEKIRQAFIGQGIVKCGGGFLMIWGYMGWNAVGILVEMEGWMDAEQYVSILEDKPFPSKENSALSKESIIFQ